MKEINIFYADDDQDDIMFFSEAIERIAAESEATVVLHIHKNGEHLIDNIRKNKSLNGVAFLDINMPLKSGLDLLQEIRNEAEIKSFPVVMYSTSSNPDVINNSKVLGADYYVVKPYRFNDLINMISFYIQLDWRNKTGKGYSFLYQ